MERSSLTKTILVILIALFGMSVSFAHTQNKIYDPKGETTAQPMFGLLANPYWYLGGNLGVSDLHDKAGVAGASVRETGPGFNVNLGYTFLQIYRGTLAGELGYTQYADSVETLPKTALARTEHYSVYLAANAMYPLVWRLGLIGKLGVAYNYARKIFYTTGASNSAAPYSVYGDLGLSFAVTEKAALTLQAARSWGNSSTGSTDLYSLGVIVNLV